MNVIAILHCSDLHFGERYESRWLLQRAPLIQGYAAHDRILCQAMPNAIDDVGRLMWLDNDESVRFVVSGDLTVSGRAAEFNEVERFLRDWLVRGRGSTLPALSMPASTPAWALPDLVTIPGNHDHWDGDGIRMWAYNQFLAGSFVEPTSWRRVWRSGDLELELVGLDSNRGLGNYWNWTALGDLDRSPGGEVDQLREILTRSDQERQDLLSGRREVVGGVARERVRALVLHHSPSLTDRESPFGFTLEPGNLSALLSLAQEFKIAAFLTGHLHFFGCPNPLVTPNGWKVWELRCANTTQGPIPRRAAKEGFYAHKIWVDQVGPHWHSWGYYFSYDRREFLPRNRHNPCLQVIP